MKDNVDIMSALAGGLGAILKGKKMGEKTKVILVNVVIGTALGYAMIDLLDFILDDGLSQKIVILISIICGTLAGEIMEASQKIFGFAIDFVGSWFKSKNKDNEDN